MRRQLLLLTLLGAMMLYFGCDKKKEAQGGDPAAALQQEKEQVEFIVIQPEDFHQEIVSNAELSACQKVEIHWNTQESVTQIFVKNGEQVKKGQLLAQVDKEALQLRLQQAQANKERAYLEMQDFLIGQGYKANDTLTIPKQVMKLAHTKSGYTVALLTYKEALMNLQQATLKAPIAGTVANLTLKPYNKLSGSFCTVVGGGEKEVVFPIMENELSAIRKGDNVVASLVSGDGTSAEGTVTQINPLVDQSGLVQVKAVLKRTPKDWYDGMKVRIRAQRSIKQQLVVPKAAVVVRDNKQVVFTIKNARAYWNYVVTERENSRFYTLSEGISAGDSVIIAGNLHLAHLSEITIK